MNWIDAAILGLVQGASEFLPISSSGHLVVVQGVLGVAASNIYLEVALHFGTLLAVIVYFWRDLIEMIAGALRYVMGGRDTKSTEQWKLLVFIVIGSIPVGIGGYLLKDWVEEAFEAPEIAGFMLLVTAVVLLGTRLLKRPQGELSYAKSFLIGIAQFVSIMPGISRSGSTIATAMYSGVEPNRAARYSFLLSIPAVAAAFLLKLMDYLANPAPAAELLDYGIGALVAFLSGLIALHYLLRLIASHRFHLFGWWCLAVGVFTIVYFW